MSELRRRFSSHSASFCSQKDAVSVGMCRYVSVGMCRHVSVGMYLQL